MHIAVSTVFTCFVVVQEDIVNAMALTGQVLMGQSVMVKSSEVSLHQGTTVVVVHCTANISHMYQTC